MSESHEYDPMCLNADLASGTRYGLAGFIPMPHADMSDIGAGCALNKTEAFELVPRSASDDHGTVTLVGTVTL